MTTYKTPRDFARHLVDDTIYEIHHSVTEPVVDCSKLTTKEIVELIDHIEKLILKAVV